MEFVPRSTYSVTVTARTWVLMLIFYFVGCAYGSCLSYGHSCWGAHGKRSGSHNGNNVRLVFAKSPRDDNAQRSVPSTASEEWVLSPLITGLPAIPLSGKYSVRWDAISRAAANVPHRWDANDQPTTNTIDNQDPRNENDSDDDGTVDERNMNVLQGIVRDMGEAADGSSEILLIPRDRYDNRDNRLDKFNFLKILRKTNKHFE